MKILFIELSNRDQFEYLIFSVCSVILVPFVFATLVPKLSKICNFSLLYWARNVG